MTALDALASALRAANLSPDITATRSLSGGCIHSVLHVQLRDGTEVVAKINRADCAPMFREEAAGLRALAATNTVRVPEPLGGTTHDNTAVLLLTYLPPADADEDAWRALGTNLAALHATDVGTRYGFDHDNHLGATYQPNAWRDDWVTFNAENRLGYQLGLAEQHRHLDPDEIERVERLIHRLPEFLPRTPKPALLHGDLWTGNALPTAHGVALIDPACSLGDGWADIAMMQLFGGFPTACFDAYAAEVNDREDVHHRIAIYQLYHVLNHVNLFGRGYAGQAMSLVAKFA